MDALDIAIHQSAHEARGGLSALAKRLGIGEQVLRNKCNPNTETHKLGVREALAVMLDTEDLRILEALAQELGCRVSREPSPQSARGLIEAVLAAEVEHGDVGRAILDALRDQRISPREAAEIKREIYEARTALEVLEASVMRLCQPGPRSAEVA